MDDVERTRARLREVESEARGQRWANERPWRTSTHVWVEDGIPVVDLHDLGAGLAKTAVRQVTEGGPARAGAVVFVHGRGRHSAGAGAVLPKLVAKQLAVVCEGEPNWSTRTIGSGRTAWITDPKRVPRSISGTWGPVVWTGWGALLAAIATAVGHALGWF